MPFTIKPLQQPRPNFFDVLKSLGIRTEADWDSNFSPRYGSARYDPVKHLYKLTKAVDRLKKL